MEILFDTLSVLGALYDLQQSSDVVVEQTIIMSHNYDKTADMDILTEGVGDILQMIIKGIRAFIDKVKALINKGFMVLNSYTMEYEKLVQKYGGALSSAQITPFTVEGFNFTVLAVNKPNTSYVYKMIEDFNSDIVKFNRYSSDDIRLMNAESLSPAYLSRLRGNVAGSKTSIDAEDFKSYMHQYYRDMVNNPINVTIDSQYIRAAIERAPILLSEQKQTKSEKDDIMSTLSRMEKFFSVKVASLYDDIQRTYNVASLQNSGYKADEATRIEESKLSDLTCYMTTKYQQVVELSNIISIVFVERMAAIKDQMMQDSQVVRMAIRKTGIVSENVSLVTKAIEEANIYPPTPNPNWAPILDGVML